MKNILVGDTSVELAGVLGDIMSKYRSGHISLDHLNRFAQMEATPFAVKAKDAKRKIEKFAAKTARKLSTVFKKRIVVDPLPPEFTDDNLALWETFNFRPVFLPREDVGANRPLKNWTKPEKWFYERVGDGKIKPIYPDLPPTLLRGCWHLADFTVGADYTDGSQVFVNDPLAPIIADLRSKKLVGKYNNTPNGSRFSITPNEWQDVVLAHVASKLGVTRAQMRLERVVDFNAIGNLYDPNRGKFNCWEWFEDFFGDSNRLYGGGRDGGGLADVSYDWSGHRRDGIAGRPLVSFVL
ncbi:MAG: hypothetical protein Q8R34_01150 [bacterium]|nr:hypothetical protein [bacterium]